MKEKINLKNYIMDQIEVYCIKDYNKIPRMPELHINVTYTKGEKYTTISSVHGKSHTFIISYIDEIGDTIGEHFNINKSTYSNKNHMWDYFEPKLIRDRKDKLKKLINE
jgi:hypothetical protein